MNAGGERRKEGDLCPPSQLRPAVPPWTVRRVGSDAVEAMAHRGDAVSSLAPDPSPSNGSPYDARRPPLGGRGRISQRGRQGTGTPDKPADQDQHHNPPNQRSHPSAPHRPLDGTYSQLRSGVARRLTADTSNPEGHEPCARPSGRQVPGSTPPSTQQRLPQRIGPRARDPGRTTRVPPGTPSRGRFYGRNPAGTAGPGGEAAAQNESACSYSPAAAVPTHRPVTD
jgi:hypothetical protein